MPRTNAPAKRKRGRPPAPPKPAPVQWTPEKLAAAAVFAAMNAGRVKPRPCLGPPDVPAHDYTSTEDERICPRCRALLKERLRGVSRMMYSPTCAREE